MTAGRGYPGQNRFDKTSKDRTAGPGGGVEGASMLGQESWEMAARTGQLGQDSLDRKAGPGQSGMNTGSKYPGQNTRVRTAVSEQPERTMEEVYSHDRKE